MADTENIFLDNAKRWHFQEIQEIIKTAEDYFFDVVDPSREQDYNYILNEQFTSAALYAKEILTLLYNGFPDGAMSLAKNLYENMILLCFFEKHKEDDELILRYFDDRKIKALSDSISLYRFLETGTSNPEIRSGISQMNHERKKSYLQYKKKYSELLNGQAFRPYWWIGDLADSCSFGSIHKQSIWYDSIFRYLYETASGQIHTGNFSKEDDSNERKTDPQTEGYQIPICFFLTAFENICHIVFSNYEIEHSDIQKNIKKITAPIFSEIWK